MDYYAQMEILRARKQSEQSEASRRREANPASKNMTVGENSAYWAKQREQEKADRDRQKLIEQNLASGQLVQSYGGQNHTPMLRKNPSPPIPPRKP